MRTQLYARESVAFDEVISVRDSAGEAVDITGWSFAADLARQAGTPDITLATVVAGSEGFTVVDGPNGSLRTRVEQATLAGVSDTTGNFTMFGDLLGTPSEGEARLVADMRLTVTVAGEDFGGSTASVVLDAVAAAVRADLDAIAASASTSAAVALAAAGPNYASIAAGNAATTSGQTFAVDNGDDTISVYAHGAGTTADALRKLIKDPAAATAAGLLGYRSRTIKAKLDDWCTPLDFGAFGDGATDDTAAIDAAMATGKHVVLPRQYTFLTSTSLGHAYSADGQIVELNGKLQHTGDRADLGGGFFGYWGMFFAQNLERIQLIGSGELNGKRTGGSLVSSDAASGVFWQRCAQAYINGVKFNDFMEDGAKVPNCPELTVGSGAWFYYCRNIAVEMRSYATNPYAGLAGVGDVWAGTTYGPSGSIDGRYEFIDDGLHGAGNGCGVDFSPEDNSPEIGPMRVTGTFLDVNRAIFSENNYPTTTAVKDIVIDAPLIRGNIRGAATAETYLGIGFVNPASVQIISPIIRNVGNFAPPPGGYCCGIVISGADTSEVDIINAQVIDDTGNANRTDYGFILNGDPTNIRIKGGKVQGVSDGKISITGAPVDLRIVDVGGADTDQSWGAVTAYGPFTATDLASSANTTLLLDNASGMDDLWLPAPGRIVGATCRLSQAPTSGAIDVKVYATGVEQTAAGITNANFGGGARGTSRCAATDTAQLAAGGAISVIISTGTLLPDATVDARVWVLVDHGVKL